MSKDARIELDQGKHALVYRESTFTAPHSVGMPCTLHSIASGSHMPDVTNRTAWVLLPSYLAAAWKV